MANNNIKLALLLDKNGKPTDQHLELTSKDWDEIAEVNDQVYMPYQVRAAKAHAAPNSTHHTCDIGSFSLSRFGYGTKVTLDQFDPEFGRGIVMTTIQGKLLHCDVSETGFGESFLIDTSQTDYKVVASEDHLQLNLAFKHQFLEDLFERWRGYRADPKMWQQKFKFGGANSSWFALLEFASRVIAENPQEVLTGAIGKHLEEMLGLNMLNQWLTVSDGHFHERNSAAPRIVRQAEEYMRAHARQAPTRTEIAEHVGVCLRTLSSAFRDFRGTSPIEYLREIRLQGVRQDLLQSDPTIKINHIVSQWGYANFSSFSQAYRLRFGETPSETLKRLRPR